MEALISRYEVLQLIDTGERFDLVFVKADRKRGTGGQVKRVRGWVKIKQQSKPSSQATASQSREMVGVSRNPNHLVNRTFNIMDPTKPHEHPVKIHWRGMLFFNGKRIIE